MLDERPRIAVLTSGGDAPGMNAAIRSVARKTIFHGGEAIGIMHGYEGLLDRRFASLAVGDVGGILDRGGTFLGTSRSARFQAPGGVDQAAEILRAEGIDGLVVVGGDGSYRGAEELHEAGIPTVGVPGTIDNDLSGTDITIGFDTALNTIADAVGKVRDTASSHERTFVIEVMGRHCGMLALHSGVACGADCILLPEVPWNIEEVCSAIETGVRRGKKHSIVILAEGAGHAFPLAEDLSGMCGQAVRTVVLGHIQRGGSPSGFDRILASRMGAAAVDALLAGETNVAVGLRCAETFTYPLSVAYKHEHQLDQRLIELARALSL
ncbi:MAG: 6-phosphofructokinase [Coriobacteriales bacterium]|nr:6-phosphofructokinase [Coriobacteriales bacterium]